jgi:hypothetical protein
MLVPIISFLSAPLLQNYPNSSLGFLQKESNPNFQLELNAIILNPIQKEIAPFFIKSNSIVSESDNIETNNAVSFENKLNDNRLREFKQKFSRQFISYILEDDFEYGMESKAHILVKEQMKINAAVTKDWLNSIYVDNFENSEIQIGILRVISRLEREEIYPIGYTMATASLNHKDEVVQETAIRAFESWGGKESLTILENVSISSKWVAEYLNEVISDLKSEYAG